MKGLAVDLVVLNEQAHSYTQELQGSLEALVRTSQSAARHEGHEMHGCVFILRKDLLSAAERDALKAAARVVLLSRQGTLAEQVGPSGRSGPTLPAPRRPSPPGPAARCAAGPTRIRVLQRPGRFRRRRARVRHGPRRGAMDARAVDQRRGEPELRLPGLGVRRGVHVVENSRENQLTPWSNDPVTDPPGEVIYVRDEETGTLWTPTVLPIREEAWPYVARHGQGYSRFEHRPTASPSTCSSSSRSTIR